MKIIHTIPYFLPSKAFGGPIYSTYYLCKELAKRGHEITLHTTNILTQKEIQKDFQKQKNIDGIKIKRHKILGRFMSYYFTPGLIRELMNEKPDLIHAHGYRNFQTDTTVAVSLLKKTPMVLHPRGMAAPEAALERGNKTGQIIYKLYDSLTLRLSLRRAQRIIATTNFEKETLKALKFLRNKIEVIPHGVDTEKFKRNEKLGEGFNEKHNINGKILLYIGRLDPGKNITALLRTASEINGKDLWVVLAGEETASTQLGTQNIKKDLSEYAHKLGLKNIVFAGGLYNEDLIAAYSAADVFVNTSISKAENFALVNLEAASCSLPVVAGPVGVAPDLLEDHSQLLFRNEEELVKILKTLLEDKAHRKKIGKELRKKVEKEYIWTKVAEKVEEVYKTVINEQLK